jgi:o-succinylbenzoate synthase
MGVLPATNATCRSRWMRWGWRASNSHWRLARRIATPVCLDEPLTSLRAVQLAVAAGACEVVNLKASRVGGLVAARQIHDWCASHGVGLWIGGMLESAVGRGVNVALAAMRGCTIPGDISPSGRVFSDNLTGDLSVRDGMIGVPHETGVTRWPDPKALARLTVQRREVFES